MTLTIRVVAVPLLVAVTHAQDVIYYKFEAGGGNKVINYASGDPTAPREGTIHFCCGLPMAKAWGKGRFGGGLAAAPVNPTIGYAVDSGWEYRVPGDLTIAFFIRMAYALPTNDRGKVIGTANDFSIYMLGVAGSRGWLTLSGCGRTTLQKDIHTLASSRWVHIAIVMQRGLGLARWYVDGKPELPQSIGSWNPRRSVETLVVGNRSGDAYWALDEVRVSLLAVPASAILAWSTAEPAAHAPFEKPCHPFARTVVLDGALGGLPRIGNAAYGLTVYGLPQSVVALGLGSNNQSFSGIPLPLDLRFLDPMLSGCFLRTSADLVRFGTIGSTGALSFSLPIPNLPGLSGARLYSQAVLANSILPATMLTNAYATVVGK